MKNELKYKSENQWIEINHLDLNPGCLSYYLKRKCLLWNWILEYSLEVTTIRTLAPFREDTYGFLTSYYEHQFY